MRIPAIKGLIERRILANFRINPEVMAPILPPPFRPKFVNGFAIGGICLIRLKGIRPRFVPSAFGLNSENAAHRIAVEWEEGDELREGVFIPRRDTNLRLNAWAGGRIFPGVHHHARFDVRETESRWTVTMTPADKSPGLYVDAKIANGLPQSSTFSSLQEASDFFESGSLGYSTSSKPERFDGLSLQCDEWKVSPLEVDGIESGFFDSTRLFPHKSVEFDCALLMRNAHHQWHSEKELCCP